MVTNREYVRKKWEELMRNPLAKELWVTEPANFEDPTYHPLLWLIIDSDDVTVINVDEFEELYSDEDSNYWNGVIREKASEFDLVKTETRRLTCVYRDGQWLDNKQIVSLDDVLTARCVLIKTLGNFRNFTCESTLSLLLIRLFETLQFVQKYEEHNCPDYSYKKNRVEHKEVLGYVRNSLVHDVWCIGDFKQFIINNLTAIGKESFNKVYELCFIEEYDLFSEIMEFINSFRF